jgi:hypothetical protein
MVFRAFQTARKSLASLTSTSFLRGRALSMLAQAPRLLDRACAGLGPRRQSLTVQNSLQPGQGDALYVLHHAMLLVANFVDKNGCRIGICIDGCDFSDNEATRPLHQLAGQRGKQYPDCCLVVDRKDLDDTRDKTGDDPRRGLVRLVDLDQLQQVNEGRYFFHRLQADALPMQVKSTLMTGEHQKLLRDGVEDGALQVEELSQALRS